MLYVGKIVLGVTVQFYDTDFVQRILFLRPYFREVERIERARFGLLFGHELHIHRPFGKISFFDAFEEVAVMAFPVFSDDSFGFLVGEVFDALLGTEVEFHPCAFPVGVDK